MLTRRTHLAVVVMAAALAVATGGCSSSTANNASATDFQQQLSAAFGTNVSRFENALQRFALAVNGIPQIGVTITPITNGVQGSVGVDVDGDGVLETFVNGRLVYLDPSQGLAGGANFTLLSIQGGAPQTTSGSALVTQTGPLTITIGNGTLTSHTETRGNKVSVSQANLTVNGSGANLVVTGSAQFTFNDLSGTLTFLPSGQSFKIQVSGNGFTTFTVP